MSESVLLAINSVSALVQLLSRLGVAESAVGEAIRSGSGVDADELAAFIERWHAADDAEQQAYDARLS